MIAFGIAAACWTLGAGAGLVFRRRAIGASLGAAGAVAGGVAAAGAAVRALGAPAALHWSTPWSVPGGAVALRLDALAAAFLLPVAVVGAACAVYGVAYLRHHAGRGRGGASMAAYNLLLLAMALVVTADNLLLLIVAWELMTLSSWALVVSDHDQRTVRAAGLQYLVAGHLATAALLLFALLFATATGGYAIAPLGPATTANAGLLFTLALIGFGTKAGLVPLHVWLPDAHPAAPSHASALMSAVMITMGFYGLARFIPLLGAPALWWAYTLMGLGAVGAVGGIAFSIAQRDVKRALAYSTVENAGLVTLAMGVGVLATVLHRPVLAGLAWGAALLHLWNHALAKSLLFLGFGAAAQRAGSRDLDVMGGLLARWPLVGGTLVLGAAAIASLPGLNVFTSEWLLLRALLAGALDLTGVNRIALLGGILAVAFTGALAAAAFARMVGVGLLGTPRTAGAANAAPPERAMRLPIVALGAGCVLVAAIPHLALGALTPAVRVVAPAADLGVAQAALRPIALLLPLLAAIVLLTLGLRAVATRRAMARRGPTWGCGYPAPTPAMQYTSTSFGGALTNVLQPLLHVETRRQTIARQLPVAGERAVWPLSASWSSSTPDRVLERLYAPAFASIARAAQRLRSLHRARVTTSLVYMVVVVVVLLGLLVLPGLNR